jgi:hypothetical protein
MEWRVGRCLGRRAGYLYRGYGGDWKGLVKNDERWVGRGGSVKWKVERDIKCGTRLMV